MRFDIRYLLVGIVLSGLPILAVSEIPENAPEKPALELQIGQHLGLIGSYEEEFIMDQLYAVVTNTSDEPVRVWDQWNSWGYDNLSFSIDIEGEERTQLRRLGSNEWMQNGADPIELGPGEHYVLAIWLKPEDRKNFTNSWGPVEASSGKFPWAELTAHYEIRPERATEVQKVWTGRISSKPMRIRLR